MFYSLAFFNKFSLSFKMLLSLYISSYFCKFYKKKSVKNNGSRPKIKQINPPATRGCIWVLLRLLMIYGTNIKNIWQPLLMLPSAAALILLGKASIIITEMKEKQKTELMRQIESMMLWTELLSLTKAKRKKVLESTLMKVATRSPPLFGSLLITIEQRT